MTVAGEGASIGATSKVDLAFPLRGSQVVRDHGYPLFSALCSVVPQIHGAKWLGVHPIAGTPLGDGWLGIRRGAHLLLRAPAERIPTLLPLAGRSLDVGGMRITLGAPRIQALVPATSLDARIVVLKLTGAPREADGTLDVRGFERRYVDELARQLAAIDVKGDVELGGRQRIRVAGRRIVGFSVRVRGLTAEGSIRLQEEGLGGKRGMGCGVFRATRAR